MPATEPLIGTPASISDSVEPQTEAIDVEPFDDRTSETTRIVYGHSLLARENGDERPLGERPVTDLTPLRRSDPACLSGRERREVVVVHVALALVDADACRASAPCAAWRASPRSAPGSRPAGTSPEPWAVEITPTSAESGRMSDGPRPSMRTPSLTMRLRTTSFCSDRKAFLIWPPRSANCPGDSAVPASCSTSLRPRARRARSLRAVLSAIFIASSTSLRAASSTAA